MKMRQKSKIEQHMALFGGSGCGKTTLLSVFYGHQQAVAFQKTAGYSLLAKDTTQGQKLLQHYHQIEENLLPPATRYRKSEFEFEVRPNGLQQGAGKLVWHDYPGEWWTESKEAEEGQRKVDTLQSLLRSDIAFFLVDGQELRKKKRQYLTSLFKQFRDEILRQREAILNGEEKLSAFPRVWTICLSKADLFPDKDVEWFRKEVLTSAADEVQALRDEIRNLVRYPDYVSLGDEFLLLSSAKFDVETGKVCAPTETIGVDLIGPIAISAPIRHALGWAKFGAWTPGGLQRVAEALRHLTTNWMKYIPVVGQTIMLFDDCVKVGIDKLRQKAASAIARKDSVEAVLALFQSRLADKRSSRVYIGK